MTGLRKILKCILLPQLNSEVLASVNFSRSFVNIEQFTRMVLEIKGLKNVESKN